MKRRRGENRKKEEKDREKVNKLIKNNFTLLLFDSFIHFSDCSGCRKQSNRNQIRHKHIGCIFVCYLK